MSVLDKFLDVMKLNDEEDFDDEFYDEEDDYEEEKPRRKFFGRSEPEEDDYDEPRVRDERKPKAKAAKSGNNKIMPIRQSSRKQGGQMEVCVVKPSSVEDSREITETLLDNRTVILNLEGLDVEIAQRIIDFTSGACFAIQGNLQKVSNYIFLVTPANVDITGDIQDILNGAFDVSALNMEF